MDNKIEQLKSVIDTLLIENALNTANLKTLTLTLHELSGHLLNEDEAKNLRRGYYHTLYEKSAELLNQPDYLFQPARAQFSLFELKSFVSAHLKDLDS